MIGGFFKAATGFGGILEDRMRWLDRVAAFLRGMGGDGASSGRDPVQGGVDSAGGASAALPEDGPGLALQGLGGEGV